MSDPKYNILITGAGSGLGRGLGLALALQGHAIIVTDLQLEGAKETAAQIHAAGGKAEAHALDVSSEQDVEGFLGPVSERSIDVLVNNAGLQHVAPVDEYPLAKWDLLMNVMLRGTFLMTRAVLPAMRAYIRTPLVDAQIKEQARTHQIPEDEVVHRIMLEPMPKKAFITIEEVAAAIGYLISPLARNITGQTITIDGGWTAR
jgi:3-hydroxybutyrate dehydrogenase